MGSHNIFHNMTAWFSTSVSQNKKNKWVQHGGKEGSFDDAQFVFSQNVTSPDTQRIFESEAYLDEHIAVFHANFISECVRKDNFKAVPIGKYFMPPKEIQKIVRSQMEFEWDLDGNTSDGTTEYSDEAVPSTSKERSPNKGPGKQGIGPPGKESGQPVSNKVTSHTADRVLNKNKDSVAKSVSKSDKSISERDSSRKDKDLNEDMVTFEDQRKTTKQTQDITDVATTASNLKRGSQEEQRGVPKENGVVYRIENLPKVTGFIEDFVPGKNNCSIYPKRRKSVDLKRK